MRGASSDLSLTAERLVRGASSDLSLTAECLVHGASSDLSLTAECLVRGASSDLSLTAERVTLHKSTTVKSVTFFSILAVQAYGGVELHLHSFLTSAVDGSES